jgi:hypothetical protein
MAGIRKEQLHIMKWQADYAHTSTEAMGVFSDYEMCFKTLRFAAPETNQESR